MEDLLNDIEDAELLKSLLTVDRLTLQISLLKMNGYADVQAGKGKDLTALATYPLSGRNTYTYVLKKSGAAVGGESLYLYAGTRYTGINWNTLRNEIEYVVR